MNIQLLNKDNSGIVGNISVEFLTSDELNKHKKAKILKKAGFSAEQDSICFLHEKGILACGIESNSSDNIRSVCSVAIKALKSSNSKSASFDVELKNIQAIIEGIVLGGYEFNEYKSKAKKSKLKNIYLACGDIDEIKATFEEAIIIAEATAFTRDIVNTIPHDLNPPSFADLAKKLAKSNGLACEILGEKKLKKERMEAMLAVGRASIHDSKLIHLTYKPKKS